MIENLINQLISKYNIELEPGKALLIPGLQDQHLILAVFDHQDRFMLARTTQQDNKPVPGFRVYYNESWQPVAAVDDKSQPLNALQQANKHMLDFLAAIYNQSPDPAPDEGINE